LIEQLMIEWLLVGLTLRISGRAGRLAIFMKLPSRAPLHAVVRHRSRFCCLPPWLSIPHPMLSFKSQKALLNGSSEKDRLIRQKPAQTRQTTQQQETEARGVEATYSNEV
jgi:hypothetical protein